MSHTSTLLPVAIECYLVASACVWFALETARASTIAAAVDLAIFDGFAS